LSTRHQDSISEFEKLISVWARTRLSGGHHSIMTNLTGQAAGRMAIAGSGQLESRELAHKALEGRDTQPR
jgi:hypothetical protein